uniref:Uncharacterized protein n=1 Tax=Anguilla anguilla TaxID=7936 RepID=A0A0E9V6H8_ANGAN
MPPFCDSFQCASQVSRFKPLSLL